MQNLYTCIPKKKVYLCILTYIIAFFFKIAMVYIISVLFNDIVARQTERMLQTILLFVAVAVLVRTLNYLNVALSNEVGLKIHAGLHTSFYESILHIEVPRAQSEDTASIAQRHLGKIQDYLLKKHITLAVEVIRMIMALAYIAFVSWQMLLFSLTAFPLVLIITGTLGGKIQQLNHSIQQKHREIDNMCVEALEGAESIRIHSLGSSLKKQFDNRLAETYREEKKLVKKLNLVNEPLSAISSFLLSIISVFWSGLMSYWGIMSIGSVISLIGFYSNLIGPIMYLMNYFVLTKSVRPSLNVVNDILRSGDRQTEDHAEEKLILKAQFPLQMKAVEFSYNENKTILNDFSMCAETGSIISICGESGVGKSTVLDLICGFLHPESGEILYWGNRMDEVNMQAVREKMAYVSQTPFFINGTILENLGYIRPDITLHDIQDINISCDGLFDDLTAYYDQPIGAFGGKLSGGMRQKLDILRLLVADADILIMDEPSSALDAISRSKLAQILRQKREEGKTILLVSHQDHIRELADRKYTLFQNEIREQVIK